MLQEKNDKHRKVLKMIDKYSEEGVLLEKRIKKILEDEDDPILARMSQIIVVIDNLSEAISDELDNGILIDPAGIK